MARFFIDRPVFAWVIAIGIMLIGLIALRSLPVSQYPTIAPPTISIRASYPGASAQTVQNTVVQIIEQQLNGLDGLLYFTSQSNRDGSSQITLTFAQGTDPDIAQVQVQNKISPALSRLPQTVQQQGVRVVKSATSYMMAIAFVSTDGKLTSNDLADFIASNVQDPLSRTSGVGDFNLFGAQYAMRIWLDPDKLVAFGLMPADISAALSSQNVQVASGELGARPSLPGQQLNATLIGPSFLKSAEEFGAILLKVKEDGAQVRLRDVARVELGAENYAFSSVHNGRPTAGIAVQLAPGANAVATAEAVRETIESLRPTLPPNVEIAYPLDTTPFVKISIQEVIKALVEAMILVFIVMFIFLQNFRATLIPTLAIPVVLLGTFAVLSIAGYSINTLTMFGMVLAIGLLVDDAIVVVENVERVMEQDGLSPLEATRVSMDQISGALVGIGLVLSAVFLPMFFFGGSAGVIYRQFSLTIITAMTLSVLVALVFTPALCATILRRPKHGERRGFFGWFNRNFDRTSRGYVKGVGVIARRPARFLVIYAALAVAMGVLYARLPTSFLPDEDQGVMYAQVVAAPGATVERTQRALDDLIDYLLTEEKDVVESVMGITGFNFSGRGQNAAMTFIRLKDWSVRKEASQSVQALAGRVMARFARYPDAMIFGFAPPAVTELGNASGFNMQLLDNAALGRDALVAARDQLLQSAAQSQVVSNVRANEQNAEPQYRLEIDWERASALGLTISQVNSTLSAAFGTSYAGDFVDRGRVKRIYMQGDASARMQPDDLSRWYVRNSQGAMVPFSAFSSAQWEMGAPRLARFNGIGSIEIQGNAAPGHTTGDAMAEMERLAAGLPQGIGISWTGLSYEERAAGSQAFALYGISMIVVFLCLAALYESWAIPASVMLVVPLGVLGAVAATLLRGMSNDVYFQVGLLTTIGLSAKNAILIVEFAKVHFEAGESLIDSALHAAKERLRPILMTSLAFVLGVVPLAIATGAGAGGRTAIGTGVVGGVVTGTLLAVFFVPLFFVVVLRLFRTRRASERNQAEARPAPAE
ncbi:efflux RND transporter permease subunit [Roseomonas marmotae]|uniref:Efflux pump membrane transporter n=1 Tax=Roseomonas marmotae TaxID=2768161 RepID=A0ABS3KAQ5_9PROT|nr:efflux RND transporter permease subunit [Roseomonas marmotae]MBO1074549.1 efflux RND transporter permease subunit [Roseomonas marmotae]QTI81582.1 efflux RND transporter permease subunit [Roseomonas marmotae]